MKKILVILCFLSFIAPIPVSAKVTNASIEVRIQEINQQIKDLKAELKTLKAQLNSSKKSSLKEETDDNDVVENFVLSQIETGTVDKEKIVVLAVFKVHAKLKDLNGDSFTSGTYFLGAQPSSIDHSCVSVISKGSYSTCRIKLKGLLTSGSYGYVVKNPSIKSLDGKNTYRTDMIIENSFLAR